MNELNKESKSAASIFLRKIIIHTYAGTIRDIRKLLEKGPAGRGKQEEKRALHNWYQKLDERDRKMVLAIVEETVKLSTFSFLVVLDNKAIGQPISDQSSDYSLHLHTYENDEMKYKYIPKTSTRINMSYSVDGDLHDEFIYLLQDREQDESINSR